MLAPTALNFQAHLTQFLSGLQDMAAHAIRRRVRATVGIVPIHPVNDNVGMDETAKPVGQRVDYALLQNRELYAAYRLLYGRSVE